ncbi:uric acid degradation bifunctional protein TTL-like [Arachis hypogaea]|uniref:uric acid degradation bifunctional protein TTL-like n=1 Tax=Arachis hypogaea TaxID=3818 RepID=UPI000DEDBE47|nr:uric acid degradation bifunctional protein TTL-like [Arachis hypogaea]
MEERDLLECCGSIKFASEMASASPFSSLQHALDVAFDIWCNKINVHSWLIALNAHTNIYEKSPFSHAFYISAPSSAMDSSIEEIYVLSVQYLQRHGFPYFTISSDWDADVILHGSEAPTSVKTKPSCEFEWARRKQFIIIEQYIAKFFEKKGYIRSTTKSPETQAVVKDFDLNKKPFWKEDLDPVAREKARRFCEIWYPGEYYV